MAAFFILHLIKTNYMDLLEDDLLSDEQELRVDEETSGYLIETSRWTKFIAITIYSLTGIFALMLVFFGKFILDAMSLSRRYDILSQSLFTIAVWLIIFVLAVAVTYYFLINFSNKIKAGIETENMETINDGLKSLKIHLIIIGIISGIKILYTIYQMIAK